MRSQDYYSKRCTNFSVRRKRWYKNWRLLVQNMVDMFILKVVLIIVKELNMENTVGIIRNNPAINLYNKIQSKKQANEWEKICNCDNEASSSIAKWRYHRHIDFLSLIWIAMKNLPTERGWKKCLWIIAEVWRTSKNYPLIKSSYYFSQLLVMFSYYFCKLKLFCHS